MSIAYYTSIAKQLQLTEKQVSQTLKLLQDGASIPFISRYRKELTGGLNEIDIEKIESSYYQIEELEKRRTYILSTIKEKGALTNELQRQIEEAENITVLEDLYLPYKSKRKTKATVAKEKGLEPLAATIMKQQIIDIDSYAERFVKGDIKNIEEALSGARDIIAEWINERVKARDIVRQQFSSQAIISAKLIKTKKEEAEKYQDYFDFSEPLKKIPSHRLLAIRRGESEGFLKVQIAPDEESTLNRLERYFIKEHSIAADQVKLALIDSYKRLLKPSIETEFKHISKEKADQEAIDVFAENLKQLLLTPPLGPKRILAIDPGFKTGCKIVCLDEKGDLLHNENIYPHPPQNEAGKAAAKISNLIEAYKLDVIAIGNGTAGRETEDFIQKRLRLNKKVDVFMVNEAGASIYSASKVAREEFPNYDVTVRGAVSIGRRLMDPLAELVKIDPKSIGVGQYQHDVDQNALKNTLDKTVINTVNQVGVNLNTASKHLLHYVSGLGPKLAESIINYRNTHGSFTTRDSLKKVNGLGPKAFEQCAGFLRISQGENPLDNSAVHPESYHVVEQIAKNTKHAILKLIGNKTVLNSIDLKPYIKNNLGLPTLNDIISELGKIGRDPRGKAQVFAFDKNIRSIHDLKEGMILNGLVSNITHFGAFVDLGVKQDGLVHVSQLANRFVKDPNEIVKLQQQVRVKIIEIDVNRKRIQLSMKDVE